MPCLQYRKDMRLFKYLLTFLLVNLGVAAVATAQTSAPFAQTPSADDIRAKQLLEEKTRELDAAPRQKPAPPVTKVPAATGQSEEQAKKLAAEAQKEAEKAAREKAIADQKLREEQERQDRINKIKADLAAQGQVTTKPAAAPVVTQAVTPAPQAPAVVVQFTGDDAQARALLEQKTRELEAAAPAATAPAVSSPAPPVVIAPTPTVTPTVSQSASDSSRSLLEEKTRELGGTTPPPASTATKSTVATSKSASTKRAAAPVVVAPVPEVDSPLPQNKQQRLSDLLETYRMNLITPADYHAARAKILAEP